MEIKVLQEDFLQALNLVQGIVERKNVMPILANVLIETEKDSLIISATDLEVAVILHVPAQILKTGKVTVLFKTLFDIIKESSSTEIIISQTDESRLHITCQNSQYKVFMMPVEEFPKLPEIKGHFQKIPAAVVMSMLDVVSFAMSSDETRQHLNGILLEKSAENHFAFVATDGHRLALVHKDLQISMKQNKVILPRKGVTELRKMISHASEFEMAVSERHIFIRDQKQTLFIRMIDGDFPDYHQVIPQSSDKNTVVLVPRLDFIGALKRVSLLSHDRSRGVSLYFCKDSLSISSSNPDLGEAKEEIVLSYKGPILSVGFNAKYLLDVFSVIKEDTVKMEFSDEISPCLVSIPSDPDFLSVIMPMRM